MTRMSDTARRILANYAEDFMVDREILASEPQRRESFIAHYAKLFTPAMAREFNCDQPEALNRATRLAAYALA